MTTPKATPGVTRGCGRRQEDAAYIECGLGSGDDAKPLEHFLCDPPRQYEPDVKRGQMAVERDGTLHIVDWIGAASYPYAADFLEEVRAHGMSRRINKQFLRRYGDRFTAETRVLCVHARACAGLPGLAHTYEQSKGATEHTRSHCKVWRMSGAEDHMQTADLPCSRHLWFDPPADADALEAETGPESLIGTRSFASTSYRTTGTADGLPLHMTPGIMAAFPISRISVIESEDGSHEATHRTVDESVPHLPVEIEHA